MLFKTQSLTLQKKMQLEGRRTFFQHQSEMFLPKQSATPPLSQDASEQARFSSGIFFVPEKNRETIVQLCPKAKRNDCTLSAKDRSQRAAVFSPPKNLIFFFQEKQKKKSKQETFPKVWRNLTERKIFGRLHIPIFGIEKKIKKATWKHKKNAKII